MAAWESTRCVVNELMKLLSCSICNELLQDPCSLSTCHHEFCLKCIGTSGTCPQCCLPYWTKDIVPFNQLKALLQYVHTLQQLLPTSCTASMRSTVNHRWAWSNHLKKPLGSLSLKRNRDTIKENIKPVVPLCTLPCKSIKRNSLGETSLQTAVIKGDTALVKRLLDEGDDPNVTDNAGWTPLHEACNHGYQRIVDLLISKGCLLNVPAYNNDTPLHDAVQNNHVDIVRTLVRAGGNIKLRNCQGHTPLDLASTPTMREVLCCCPIANLQITPLVHVNSCRMLLASGLKPYQRALLTQIATSLGADVVTGFSSQVTHVITDCNEMGCSSRTMKCLSAIARGCWLLNFQWLADSMEQQLWVKEESYLVKGFHYQGQSYLTDSARNGYSNTIEKLPRLFDGLKFYFMSCPSKEDLMKLVQYGGGSILTREPKSVKENDQIFTSFPFHAVSGSVFCTWHTLIICNPVIATFSSTYIATLPISWILDSLSHFKLIELPHD